MSAKNFRRMGSVMRLDVNRDLLVRIDAWAFRHGLTREEAVKLLLKRAVRKSRREEHRERS